MFPLLFSRAPLLHILKEYFQSIKDIYIYRGSFPALYKPESKPTDLELGKGRTPLAFSAAVPPSLFV